MSKKITIERPSNTYDEIVRLSERLGVDMGHAVQLGVALLALIVDETDKGNRVKLARGDESIEIVIPELGSSKPGS